MDDWHRDHLRFRDLGGQHVDWSDLDGRRAAREAGSTTEPSRLRIVPGPEGPAGTEVAPIPTAESTASLQAVATPLSGQPETPDPVAGLRLYAKLARRLVDR